MTLSATIPVTVTPEAAMRIAELGFQAQVDRMIEHARQNLPEIVRIDLVLNEHYDMGGEPGVSIDAYSRRPFDPADEIDRDLSRWMVTEFPPEVLEHLLLDYRPGPGKLGNHETIAIHSGHSRT